MQTKEQLQEKHAAIEAQMRKLAEEKLSIESSIDEIEYKESHEVYAIGRVLKSLWRLDERFSFGKYLTSEEALGYMSVVEKPPSRPSFKSGQTVVLLKRNDEYRWYTEDNRLSGPFLDENNIHVELLTTVKEKT